MLTLEITKRFSIATFIFCLLSTASPAYSQTTLLCDVIADSTSFISEVQKKDRLNKYQLQQYTIKLFKSREIKDSSILDLWMENVDWIFKSSNLNLTTQQTKEKRFEECRAELKSKGY
jgi:hypothetical protein